MIYEFHNLTERKLQAIILCAMDLKVYYKKMFMNTPHSLAVINENEITIKQMKNLIVISTYQIEKLRDAHSEIDLINWLDFHIDFYKIKLQELQKRNNNN